MIQKTLSLIKNIKPSFWKLSITGIVLCTLIIIFQFIQYELKGVGISLASYFSLFCSYLVIYFIWAIVYVLIKKNQVKTDNIYFNMGSYLALIIPWFYWYFGNTLLSFSPIFLYDFLPIVSLLGLVAGLVFALRSRAISSIIAVLFTILFLALSLYGLSYNLVNDDTPRYITYCKNYGHIYSRIDIIGENGGRSKPIYQTKVYYINANKKVELLGFEGRSPNYKLDTGKVIKSESPVSTDELATCLKKL